MQKTKIEYLTHTWNPLAMRCTPVSEGCANCWHLRTLPRLIANPMIPEDRKAAYQNGAPVLIEKELDAPLVARYPAVIGVQFMGDLFHGAVPDDFIDQVFEVMILRPWHTFLVLTKRPERMREYIVDAKKREPEWVVEGALVGKPLGPLWQDGYDLVFKFPSHIWLGTTAENQAMADERITEVLKLKAMFPGIIVYVSIEPCLEGVHISGYLDPAKDEDDGPPLDWVIVGGESGPGARDMDPAWPRSIRDQCRDAGVPFFFKQWKAKAGRELDGRTWDEMPGGE